MVFRCRFPVYQKSFGTVNPASSLVFHKCAFIAFTVCLKNVTSATMKIAILFKQAQGLMQTYECFRTSEFQHTLCQKSYDHWFPFHATFFWDRVSNFYISYMSEKGLTLCREYITALIPLPKFVIFTFCRSGKQCLSACISPVLLFCVEDKCAFL